MKSSQKCCSTYRQLLFYYGYFLSLGLVKSAGEFGSTRFRLKELSRTVLAAQLCYFSMGYFSAESRLAFAIAKTQPPFGLLLTMKSSIQCTSVLKNSFLCSLRSESMIALTSLQFLSSIGFRNGLKDGFEDGVSVNDDSDSVFINIYLQPYPIAYLPFFKTMGLTICWIEGA